MVFGYDFTGIAPYLDCTVQELCKSVAETQNAKLITSKPSGQHDLLLRSDAAAAMENEETTLYDCLLLMVRHQFDNLVVFYKDGVPDTNALTNCAPSIEKEKPIHFLTPLGSVEFNWFDLFPTAQASPRSALRRQSTCNIKILFDPPKEGQIDAKKLRDYFNDNYRFVDCRDIVAFFIAKFMSQFGDAPSEIPEREKFRDFMIDLVKTPIGGIANIAKKKDGDVIDSRETLRSAARRFENCSRLPVFHVSEEAGAGSRIHHKDVNFAGVLTPIDVFSLTQGPLEQSCISSGALLKRSSTLLTPADTFTAASMMQATQPLTARAVESTVVDVNTPLLKGIASLVRSGFTSLPLLERNGTDKDRVSCIGILTCRDVVPFILAAVPPPSQTAESVVRSLPSERRWWRKLGIQSLRGSVGAFVQRMRAVAAEENGSRTVVLSVQEDVALDVVIAALVLKRPSLVTVEKRDGTFSGILSSTDFGRFIARELAKIPMQPLSRSDSTVDKPISANGQLSY